MTRRCAISVDLDEISLYRSIHGIADPVGSETQVHSLAVERLSAWSTQQSLPLTWFVVARDLESPGAAQQLARLAALGHEIGNHTLDHRYDLVSLSRTSQQEQILGAADRIQAVTGERPRGFRAPGYLMSDSLFEILEDSGYLYDSSVFPCPGYWLAKAAVLGLMFGLGRRSHAELGSPAVLLAPTAPYRRASPFYRRGGGLLEIPIQVTPGLRLPFIGTSLTMAGALGARWLTRTVVGAPLVNLELHGIDALDYRDGLDSLRSVQPDVRVPVEKKLMALDAAVGTLRSAGYEFVPLSELARSVSAA